MSFSQFNDKAMIFTSSGPVLAVELRIASWGLCVVLRDGRGFAEIIIIRVQATF